MKLLFVWLSTASCPRSFEPCECSRKSNPRYNFLVLILQTLVDHLIDLVSFLRSHKFSYHSCPDAKFNILLLLLLNSLFHLLLKLLGFTNMERLQV